MRRNLNWKIWLQLTSITTWVSLLSSKIIIDKTPYLHVAKTITISHSHLSLCSKTPRWMGLLNKSSLCRIITSKFCCNPITKIAQQAMATHQTETEMQIDREVKIKTKIIQLLLANIPIRLRATTSERNKAMANKLLLLPLVYLADHLIRIWVAKTSQLNNNSSNEVNLKEGERITIVGVDLITTRKLKITILVKLRQRPLEELW